MDTRFIQRVSVYTLIGIISYFSVTALMPKSTSHLQGIYFPLDKDQKKQNPADVNIYLNANFPYQQIGRIYTIDYAPGPHNPDSKLALFHAGSTLMKNLAATHGANGVLMRVHYLGRDASQYPVYRLIGDAIVIKAKYLREIKP